MKKKYNKKAFSLIELSIVILIISILVTGTLTNSKGSNNNSKNRITIDRTNIIYKALTNFVANNRRLPCPAIITIAKGGTYTPSGGPTYKYGQETGTDCANTFTSSNNAPNLVYGMIPTIALGLSPDMAEDGWGTKFSYVVDRRFTSATTSLTSNSGFEYQPGTSSTSIITIQGPSGTNILTNALFVIISHGANQYNGFNATGTSQNTQSSVSDEDENGCDGGSTCGAATSFNTTFIAYSTNSNFDDLTLYKTKNELNVNSGSEFIKCSSRNISTTDPNDNGNRTWSTNAEYGCQAPSDPAPGGGCRYKTCKKYGIWSTYSSQSTTNCNCNKCLGDIGYC